MKVAELFTLHQGNSFELINMEIDRRSGVNFVARTGENNGVTAKIKVMDAVVPFPAGYITVALGGSVLSSFVQYKHFYTGFHVMVLEPKNDMRLEEKLFYCHCIKMNAYRYRYGRQANKTLKDIELPELPDWLSSYTIDYSRIETKIEKKELPFDTSRWEEFRVGDLFNICGTRTTKINILKEYGSGNYPYVTTQASNNGVEGFYNYWTEQGKVLVIDSAVAGFCSYQDSNFSASDHVEKLVPHFIINRKRE
jgi:restriction endonuclease S subunit